MIIYFHQHKYARIGSTISDATVQHSAIIKATSSSAQLIWKRSFRRRNTVFKGRRVRAQSDSGLLPCILWREARPNLQPKLELGVSKNDWFSSKRPIYILNSRQCENPIFLPRFDGILMTFVPGSSQQIEHFESRREALGTLNMRLMSMTAHHFGWKTFAHCPSVSWLPHTSGYLISTRNFPWNLNHVGLQGHQVTLCCLVACPSKPLIICSLCLLQYLVLVFHKKLLSLCFEPWITPTLSDLALSMPSTWAQSCCLHVPVLCNLALNVQ